MNDFFEIDFLDIETQKSGDAIPMRYSIGGVTRIHVTDGGFVESGEILVDHIRKFYDNPQHIHSVVVTHPDADHAGGVRKLFEEFTIGELWMLRPWQYSNELIQRFSRFTSVDNLTRRLKELYPNIAILEELAMEYDVPIREPFQGSRIGEFTVMAPTRDRYLDLVVESEKTPEATVSATIQFSIEAAGRLIAKAISMIRSAWGYEVFPPDDTSAENNMSVIQYANLCGKRILLTADAGRAALDEAADYAPFVGLALPGVDRIQVPHHGSRHNVSTAVLNRWLGPQQPVLNEVRTAVVSAARADKDHPRNSVVRAFIHRGCKVITTESGTKCTGHNAPPRDGWETAPGLPYPEEQESE